VGRKKNKNKLKSSKKKLGYSPFILALGLTFLAVTGFLVFANSRSSLPERPIRESFDELIETRPVLSPTLFSGRTALAYQLASEIPEAIDNQFCYCYCRKNFNHKTLLTCFTDEHGSKCSICQGEVFRTYKLYKEGLTMDEIVKKIDKEFYRRSS
jgi:hypothetical protein